MGDSDDDFDDLWGELEDEPDSLNVGNLSANLMQACGIEGDDTVHKGDVDEGRITWEAPTNHGLDNSEKVTVAGRHWYKDGSDDKGPGYNQVKVSSQAGSLIFTQPPGPAPAGKDQQVGETPAFMSMFQFNDNGSIKW